MFPHLHIDAGAGVTGPALLAALADLAPPRAALTAALAALPATAEGRLAQDARGALRLDLPGDAGLSRAETRAQLASAPLAQTVRNRVGAALDLDAPALDAGPALPRRELGLAVLVAAAVEALAPATLSSAPLPLPRALPGDGFAALLAPLGDTLVRITDVAPAAVSPLGLALVRSLAEPGAQPPILERPTAGSGDDPETGARVRVLAGTPAGGPAATGDDELVLLETNLDDLQPELLALLIPGCLEAGALDAWLTPVVMKKGRPAHVLSALCRPRHRGAVEALLFRESSTLGVRRTRVARRALQRRLRQVQTPWGAVAVKVGLDAGTPVNWAPEFEDCRRLAAAAGVPTQQVYAAALGACPGPDDGDRRGGN